MTTGIGNSPYQAAVPLAMSGTVANGGTLSSAAFAIPALNAGTALCDRYDVDITCNLFTATAGGYVDCNITANRGNGYDPLFVNSGQLFPDDLTFGVETVNTGTLIAFKGLEYPSLQQCSTAAVFNLLNESGVSLVVTGATMYPYGKMAG